MGVGIGLHMYDVVVKEFTFAISSADEFLSSLASTLCLQKFVTNLSCYNFDIHEPSLIISGSNVAEKIVVPQFFL